MLNTIYSDVNPHMARTMGARTRGYEPHEEIIMSQSMSYAEELMYNNPTMDSVHAQQLENWAEQREIFIRNKELYYERPQVSCDAHPNAYEQVDL